MLGLDRLRLGQLGTVDGVQLPGPHLQGNVSHIMLVLLVSPAAAVPCLAKALAVLS